MDDELKERIKEIQSNLYCVKNSIRQVDNPEILENGLFAVIHMIDDILNDKQ